MSKSYRNLFWQIVSFTGMTLFLSAFVVCLSAKPTNGNYYVLELGGSLLLSGWFMMAATLSSRPRSFQERFETDYPLYVILGLGFGGSVLISGGNAIITVCAAIAPTIFNIIAIFMVMAAIWLRDRIDAKLFR